MKFYIWVFLENLSRKLNFHEILYLSIFGKSIEKIQFSWNFIFEYFWKICTENSIFMKFYIWVFLENLSRKLNFHEILYLSIFGKSVQKIQFSWNFIFEYFWKICPENSIFIKFYNWVFLENLSRKFKSHYNLTTITGTLHADRYTFLIISRSILLRMRNVSDKSCREIKTHILYSVSFFFPSKIVPFMR